MAVEQFKLRHCPPDEHQQNHHIPGWYKKLHNDYPGLTPETIVLPLNCDIVHELTVLQKTGWTDFFIKDYVKSLKEVQGAWGTQPIIGNPTQAPALLTAQGNKKLGRKKSSKLVTCNQ